MSSNEIQGLGDNTQINYVAEELARLEKDYGGFEQTVADVLNEARAHPSEINDDETMGKVAATVKKIRDLNDRLEGLRVKEKEPYLRRGEAVQTFFKKWMDKLIDKQSKKPAGAADILQRRVNDWVNRKAAVERRRLEEEARVKREEEQRLQRERDEKERLRLEEEQRALRARKPENKDAATQAAASAGAEARELAGQADQATTERREAEAATTQKTADLVRTRTDEGHTVTARQEGYVEITDEMKLDPVKLWAFVKSDAKLAALKSWAKTTQYKTPMDGAVIEMRDKAVIR